MDLVSEHSQVQEQKEGQGSPQSESTARFVNKLLERSRKASEEMRSRWPENYNFVVNGQQWDIRRPRWRFSEVVNVTWSNIMTEVGIQTDSRPRVDYTAVELSDFQFAEILKEINEVNWSKSEATGHGWERQVATGVFKSKLYEVVHAYVGWDEELENGLGDVEFKVLNPYGSFWDPQATNMYENRWFIQADPMPTSWLKKKYPHAKEQIKPDVGMFENQTGDGVDDHNIDRFFFSGRLQNVDNRRTDRLDGNTGGEELTLWIRCWLKDDTVEEVLEETQQDGEQIAQYILKKKYPKGRYIEVCNSVTLKDEENQFEDGLFPIARLVNYDYGEYVGENEVTHNKGPQKILNYTWSHVLDQMKMASNPQTIVSNRASSIVNKLTNEPGTVVEVGDINSDIRKEAGVGIAPGSFNIVELSLSLVDKVGGLQDATRGAPQPGVTSGLMLEGFVEAAQTRPRLKNRSLDEFLRQVGYLMASRYLQYYTAPRSFRITNKEGWPESVTFFIKEDATGRKAMIERQEMQQSGGQPVLGPVRQEEFEVKGIPDVKVVSGSSLPFAKAQKTATALDLYTREAIDQEELLTAINWPNAEEVVRRMEEKAAAAAQAEQEAAMQQGA
jgi:hypothetical protein